MRARYLMLTTILTVSALVTLANEYYTATTDLKARTGAGRNYPVSFILRKGDIVEFLSATGNWYKIQFGGKVGFVYSTYLETIYETNSAIAPPSDTGPGGFSALMIVGIIGFFWLLPILAIASSSRTTAGEKTAWILAVIFISWFSWIFYMLLAPIKKND